MKFYYLKFSCPKKPNNSDKAEKKEEYRRSSEKFLNLINKLLIAKETVSNFLAVNVPNKLAEAKVGDLVFIQCAGDNAQKRVVFKNIKELQAFPNGLHALGIIKSLNPDDKELTLDIYPFDKETTKLDLYLYPQFLDNLGCDTKGTATQAGLYDLTEKAAKGLLDYINLNKGLNSANPILQGIDFNGWLKKSTIDAIAHIPKYESNKILANNIIQSPAVAQSHQRETVTTGANFNKRLTKPFLLLAGISGTGKTRFVREQAGMTGSLAETYQLVSVRPDWHEPSDVLGYTTRLSGEAEYVTTDVLKFLVKAWKAIAPQAVGLDASGYRGSLASLSTIPPYWLCLDEMNLAPVEQYFADYLSVLETREWIFQDDESFSYRCDPLLSKGVIAGLKDEGRKKLRTDLGLDGDDGLWGYFSEHGVGIPFNLIVAGTVNMDETTHGFSRKVIDRALTIDFGEFFPNEFEEFFDQKTKPKALSYPIHSNALKAKECLPEVDNKGEKSIKFLQVVNGVLADSPFALAYRALNELLLSVVSNEPSDEKMLQAVWDDFLMCKVLPRVEGDVDKLGGNREDNLLTKLSKVLSEKLDKIWEGAERQDLLRGNTDGSELNITCKSKEKIEWMQAKLERGYTTFWQ